MLKNDTKFQAQTERANFCSFPIEHVKGAQIETNSKVKLSKNMWLQTSNWHVPNSWAPRQQDAEEIDDKAKARKGKGTWSNPSQWPSQTQIRGEKQMKGKTKPRNQRAHQINHLMVASWLSKNTKSLKVHASSTILGNQLICNMAGSIFLQSLAQHNNHSASGKFFLSL